MIDAIIFTVLLVVNSVLSLDARNARTVQSTTQLCSTYTYSTCGTHVYGTEGEAP